jgi:anti-sigma factor RsiW
VTDATTHLTEEERQTLADGTIGADRAQAARAHVRACAACADDVARLERTIMRGRQLEEPTTDVGELWPGIRARIENTKVVALPAEPVPTARRAARPRVATAAIAAIAAVLVIAIWLGVRTKVGTDDRTVSRGRSDTVASIEFVDDSVRAYKEEAQVLLDRLELTRSMLQPGAAAAIDKDLAVVDSAIAELQTAIARDPRNRELRRLLATSYREKIEVLERVSNAG